MAKLETLPSPWFGWSATVRELQEGEFPHLQTIAEALRGGEPLPPEVSEFLAGYIEGSIRRPRGRTKYRDTNAIDREIDEAYLRGVFEDLYERAQNSVKPFNGTPFEVALERTAMAIKREFGIILTPDGIKKRLKMRDRSKHGV